MSKSYVMRCASNMENTRGGVLLSVKLWLMEKGVIRGGIEDSALFSRRHKCMIPYPNYINKQTRIL